MSHKINTAVPTASSNPGLSPASALLRELAPLPPGYACELDDVPALVSLLDWQDLGMCDVGSRSFVLRWAHVAPGYALLAGNVLEPYGDWLVHVVTDLVSDIGELTGEGVLHIPGYWSLSHVGAFGSTMENGAVEVLKELGGVLSLTSLGQNTAAQFAVDDGSMTYWQAAVLIAQLYPGDSHDLKVRLWRQLMWEVSKEVCGMFGGVATRGIVASLDVLNGIFAAPVAAAQPVASVSAN